MIVSETHIALESQLCKTYIFFFIPGDTIACNITYHGKQGPPGSDGPPGIIVSEVTVIYTSPFRLYDGQSESWGHTHVKEQAMVKVCKQSSLSAGTSG
jgi:hypothetical protein